MALGMELHTYMTKPFSFLIFFPFYLSQFQFSFSVTHGRRPVGRGGANEEYSWLFLFLVLDHGESIHLSIDTHGVFFIDQDFGFFFLFG